MCRRLLLRVTVQMVYTHEKARGKFRTRLRERGREPNRPERSCVCVCVRARAYCYEKRARSRAPSVVVAAVVVVVVVVTTRIQARGTTLCRRLGVCMHIRCIHCTPTRDRSLRSNSRGRDSSSSSTSSNFSTAARLCFVPQFLSFFHLNSISSRGKNDK